jgi:hypothetical protein
MWAGVQSKNNEYHIVDKVENVLVNKYIFDLIDNVVFVVLALYSSGVKINQFIAFLQLKLNMKENSKIQTPFLIYFRMIFIWICDIIF